MTCILSPQKTAQAQAVAIEDYWARKGHPGVRCVVVVEFDAKGRQVFGVRSNLRFDSRPDSPARARKR